MNDIFIPTLNQILYLVTLIIIGYILIKIENIVKTCDKNVDFWDFICYNF